MTSAIAADGKDCAKWGEGTRDRILCEEVQGNVRVNKEMNTILDILYHRLLEEEAKHALKETQSAWKNFADQSCIYERTQWLQGREIAIGYEICMRQKTTERIDQLNNYLNCSENGCPAMSEIKE